MSRFALWDARFLLYVAGGVVSAAVDIGVMQMLIAGGVHPLLATSAGFATSLLVNYLFHARLTFRDAAAGAGSFARYLALVLANYLLTLAFVAAWLALFGQPLVGKLLSLPVIAVNGYLLGKHRVFK